MYFPHTWNNVVTDVLLSGHTLIKLSKKCTSSNGLDIKPYATGRNWLFKPWYLKCQHTSLVLFFLPQI